MINSLEATQASHEELWQKSLEIIRENVNPRSFQTWFSPLKALNISEDTITLGVPNKFFCEWLDNHYLNLLKNAVHSMEDHLNPRINITSNRSNDRTLLIIEDNGNGIPFNMLDYVFMPFFTTKQGGSGIGLTLSRQIMKAHNGLINLVSKEGEGTKVILIF